MLGNRPLGIVCTAILGTVALMGANVANAVIDVDSDSHTTIEYARESLQTELQPTADGPKYCLVKNTDSGIDSPLEIVVDMDPAATGQESVYVRVDLTNMIFGMEIASGKDGHLQRHEFGQNAATHTSPPKSDGAVDIIVAAESGGAGVVSGGDRNHDYIILSVGRLVTEDDEFVLRVPSFGVLPDLPGGVALSFYDTVDDAQAGGVEGRLKHRTVTEAVKIVEALQATGTPSKPSVTADVETEFQMFVLRDRDGTGKGADTLILGQIGKFGIDAKAGVLAADDGMSVAIGDLHDADALEVTIAGDMSIGEFSLQGTTGKGENGCTDATSGKGYQAVTPAGEDKTMVTLTAKQVVDALDGAEGEAYLCVVVPGDKEVPESEFNATTTFGKVTTNKFASSEQMDLIGSIIHNGTTVHIPFVTAGAVYNQRFILTNRGDKEVTYSIEVFSEADAGATVTSLLTNETLPANSTVIKSASEVMTFGDDGLKRGSAEFTANAPPSKISVATSIRHMSGSTDTVQHTKNRADGES